MTERSAPTASLNSDRSSEQLIEPVSDVSAKSDGRRVLAVLGLGQLISGALLSGAGALALLKGAALARVCAGIWAGAAGVVAGVVGVLAGLGECNGSHTAGCGVGGAVVTHLVVSLVALGGAQAAAALAAAGLHRDIARANTGQASFQEEMLAWWPVVSNACVLASACCAGTLSALGAWRAHAAGRRRAPPYQHNQFEPGKDSVAKSAPIIVDETKAKTVAKQLTQQRKLHKEEWGSATSRSGLVSRWLVAPPAGRPPVMLVPASAASHNASLGRGRGCVMMSPRYATLPAPPFAPPHPHPLAHPQLMHPTMYYPVHDNRVRRRRSPRGVGALSGARRRGARGERGVERSGQRSGERGGSQLTRSLERMHRRRRDPPTDTEADLKRTYTGLDRAYAEQFIAVCDESRHASEHHDSLPSDTNS